jgi:hypothetical protein
MNKLFNSPSYISTGYTFDIENESILMSSIGEGR